MKNVSRVYMLVLVMCMALVPAVAHGKKFKLTGSQKAGNIAHGPVLKSPPVVLTTPATIVKVQRHGKSFTIWKDGKVFVNIVKNMEIQGVLPAGRYTLRPEAGGSVTIFLDTAAKPKKLTLWSRQKRGPNHWIEGNRVVIAVPTKIKGAQYDGTDSVGIFPAGSHKYFYRFVSPHNMKEKGPVVRDAAGVVRGKSFVGLVLPPGVYEIVPGIGTADHIVTARIEL